MSYTINGTCSICGGAVTTPTMWHGIIPPVPTCSQCGAVPAAPHGPVIPMKPASRPYIEELRRLLDLAQSTGNPPPNPDTTTSVQHELRLSCSTATGAFRVRTIPNGRQPLRTYDTTGTA